MLDEVARAGRENVDADHVERYDTKEDANAAEELLALQEFGLDDQSRGCRVQLRQIARPSEMTGAARFD